MSGTTTKTVDLNFGYSADIATEVSGEGNGKTTLVTSNFGSSLGRKVKVEHLGDSLTIETVGEWESTSMAHLFRALADALQSDS